MTFFTLHLSLLFSELLYWPVGLVLLGVGLTNAAHDCTEFVEVDILL